MTLESSITLEDVLAVVASKRVPLAPELAGYLALEIAEGVGSAGGTGDLDPRQVYVGDEGTVAVVRSKRPATVTTTAAADPLPNEAEAAIRGVLLKLLEASGSQTPALALASRRGPGAGLTGLAQELEAALIPVNRAAGRRALARLAREVKRVTMGVGRNASLPPAARAPSPSYSQIGKQAAGSAPGAGALAPPPASGPASSPTSAPAPVPAPAPAHAHAPAAPTPPPAGAAAPEPSDAALEAVATGGDEVDSLLSQFEVSDNKADLAVSRDLKAMAGLEPTPPPPGTGEADEAAIESLLALTGEPGPAHPSDARTPPPPSRGLVTSTLAGTGDPLRAAHAISPLTPLMPSESHDAPPPPSARARDSAPAPARAKLPSYGDDRSASTQPSLRQRDGFRPPRAPKTDRFLTLLLLGLLAVGVVLVWMLKPGFFTGRTPDKVAAEKAAAERSEREAAAARAAALTCKATLTVDDAPAGSEVLLRVGQAPADVEHMPVGARLEFVATAEGFAPKRTVVPAGATWDNGTDGKPRYEVAVQLDPAKAKPPKVDPWPPGEPGSEVGGKGSPGTVHVVSTPKGAEVWLLAGLGPTAVIEQLPCTSDVDVLVAGPTTFRKRVHVKQTDFAETRAAGGAPLRTARVSAK